MSSESLKVLFELDAALFERLDRVVFVMTELTGEHHTVGRLFADSAGDMLEAFEDEFRAEIDRMFPPRPALTIVGSEPQ